VTTEWEDLGGVVLTPRVDRRAVKNMLDRVEGIQFRTKVSGYFTVFSQTGMQEAALAVGDDVTPLNVSIALDKIKTVLATQRSTRQHRQKMIEEGLDRSDFAGEIGSLLPGGVALYYNNKFVGAIAFSSNSLVDEEEFCLKVLEGTAFDPERQNS